MTKLMFACAAVFALTACPGKQHGGEALSKMVELKDKMCACKTPACATAVVDEQAKWAKSMGTEPEKVSEEETKKLTAVGQEFGKCLADATKVAAPEPVAPTAPVPVETGSGSAGSAAK